MNTSVPDKPYPAHNLDVALSSIVSMPREQLECFMGLILDTLYGDRDDAGNVTIDPDKEWDQGTIEQVDIDLLKFLNPRVEPFIPEVSE
jgi:hypothetical protein